MTLIKKLIISTAGIVLLTNSALGISKEKQGHYKIYGSEKNYSVMTDSNKDNILDRVDEYENNKKTITLFRDDDGEIVEFNWKDNSCSYFKDSNNKEINKKWGHYEKIIWPDRS